MTRGEEYIKAEQGYRPRIDGTRITVQQVVEYRNIYGWDESQVAEAFRLTLAQVHAALTYYYDHQSEIDAALAHDREQDQDLPGLLETSEGLLMLIMTPQEVAEQYPISVDAIYQAIRRQRLPARQSGKTWLILRRDAERLWGHRRAKAS
jgi:excisionase family DNA binding protein